MEATEVALSIPPKHRVLAFLVAAGYTSKQCSEALLQNGITLNPQYINIIRRGAAFKQFVLEIQRDKMGGTLGAYLSRLGQEALPSLNTLTSLRDESEDDGVRFRSAAKLVDSFESASGLKRRADDGQDKGPIVQVNLTSDEQSAFAKAIMEARTGKHIVDGEVIPEPMQAKAEPAEPPEKIEVEEVPPPRPRRAMTIQELLSFIPQGEKLVESGAC